MTLRLTNDESESR